MSLPLNFTNLKGVTGEQKDAIAKFEKQRNHWEMERLKLKELIMDNLKKNLYIFTTKTGFKNRQWAEAEAVEAKKLMDEALDACIKLGVHIEDLETFKLLYYNRVLCNTVGAEEKPEMQHYELMENRTNEPRPRNDDSTRNLAKIEKELKEDRMKATKGERLKGRKRQLKDQVNPLREKKLPLSSICNKQEQKTSKVHSCFESSSRKEAQQFSPAANFLSKTTQFSPAANFLSKTTQFSPAANFLSKTTQNVQKVKSDEKEQQLDNLKTEIEFFSKISKIFRKEKSNKGPQFYNETMEEDSTELDFFSNIEQILQTMKSDEEKLRTQSIPRKPTATDQHQETALPRLQKSKAKSKARSNSSDVEHVASLDAIHIAKGLQTEKQESQTFVDKKQQAAKSGSGKLQAEKALRGKGAPLVAKKRKERKAPRTQGKESTNQLKRKKKNEEKVEPKEKIKILKNRLI